MLRPNLVLFVVGQQRHGGPTTKSTRFGQPRCCGRTENRSSEHCLRSDPPGFLIHRFSGLTDLQTLVRNDMSSDAQGIWMTCPQLRRTFGCQTLVRNGMSSVAQGLDDVSSVAQDLWMVCPQLRRMFCGLSSAAQDVSWHVLSCAGASDGMWIFLGGTSSTSFVCTCLIHWLGTVDLDDEVHCSYNKLHRMF